MISAPVPSQSFAMRAFVRHHRLRIFEGARASRYALISRSRRAELAYGVGPFRYSPQTSVMLKLEKCHRQPQADDCEAGMTKIEAIRLIAATALCACAPPVAAEDYNLAPTALPPTAIPASAPVVMYPPPPPPDFGAIIAGTAGGLVGGALSYPVQAPGAIAKALAPPPANRVYVGAAPGWAWDSVRGWVPVVPGPATPISARVAPCPAPRKHHARKACLR
jgi:hypothetical protein